MSNKIKRLDATGLTRILTNIYSEIASFSKKTISTAKDYVDTKISDLINGAPTTLDTLGEIAQAMSENKDVVEALDEAIGTKATLTDLITHTGDTDNPHEVTKEQVGLDKVENKSSADIRGELTKSNVTTALGYTPPTNGFKKYSVSLEYPLVNNVPSSTTCTLPSDCSDGFMVVLSQYEQYLYLITCRSSISIIKINGGSTVPTATRTSGGISVSNIPYIGSMNGSLIVYSFK